MVTFNQLIIALHERIEGYGATLHWAKKSRYNSQINIEVLENKIAAYKDILNLINEKT